MRIEPFQPLLPQTNEVATKLTCPPYDVLTCSEAQALLAEGSSSFLRVTRPDATNPPSTDPNALYNSAKVALKDLQSTSQLVKASHPTLYIYSQTLGNQTQHGLICLVHVTDYTSNIIKRHERTRPDKEADRTALTDTLSANTGPVFLTYPDDPTINSIIEKIITSTDPLYNLTLENPPETHTVIPVPPEQTTRLTSLFQSNVPISYIADGHHRAASAANVASSRQTKIPSTTSSSGECFLAALFPASQLRILPYNRLISDLNHHTPQAFLTALGKVALVAPLDPAPTDPPPYPGTVYLFLAKQWYSFSLPASPLPDPDSPGDALDCAVLQSRVLAPLLGIDDPRKSERIQFAGGVKGLAYLEEQVREGEAAVAFALHPVSVEQLMSVADCGGIMPPKSTWFEPKLRSGFFVHCF